MIEKQCENCDFYMQILKDDKEKKCGLTWKKPPKEILEGEKKCEKFEHDMLL